ncbi:sensor histidine kinase KdpD [Pelagibius sp. Alg239-R121]|uniref:sensor histidine kinase n=1 Tax=Pelagibius sp. Alg239-R121 TaxID=2993448 RepID=UPI0024A76278|nr:ATP-binding protein [Pelagibius sp. Alg239-R121]
MANTRPTASSHNRRLFHSRIFRLALIYLCLFTASVLGLLGFIYWSATESVTRQIDSTIDAEITGLAEQYNQRGLVGLIQAIERRAGKAGETRGLYILADKAFEPLAGNLSRWPDELPDQEGWVTFRLEYPDDDGGSANFGRARVFDLGKGIHLLVGHDIQERSRIASSIRGTLIWSVVVTIGVSLVGGILMSRSLLRQIDTINETSREIMAGDMSRRIPIGKRGDEIDEVAGNLNAMLDQIERLLAGMSEISDNIAHDLRTPISRLRTGLESALIGQPDPEGYREAVRKAIEEADNILKTFNALLSIAQAEAGATEAQFESVDLDALLQDVSELYEPLAEEQDIKLKLDLAQSARLDGDRNLLFQAVANLVDNALKFSPKNSVVTISLLGGLEDNQKPDISKIVVADQGPGIPDQSDRKRVLERFHRLEASRSTPGNGLGLSLVAAVAKLHGGTLELDDNAPGLRATLSLPQS